MLEVMRVLIKNHQYSSDTYLLLSAVLGSGIKPADSFANLNLQKFLLREIKLWDSAANGDPRLKWNHRTMRWVLPNGIIGLNTKEQTEDTPDELTDDISLNNVAAVRPKKRSAVLYAIYGEVLLIAKSYQSAIRSCRT
jgi:general transcription factor 3C polypeptide 3 (transcription factor C subunit 4)